MPQIAERIALKNQSMMEAHILLNIETEIFYQYIQCIIRTHMLEVYDLHVLRTWDHLCNIGNDQRPCNYSYSGAPLLKSALRSRRSRRRATASCVVMRRGLVRNERAVRLILGLAAYK